MKKIVILSLALVNLILNAASFNVRDFGAKGDGKSDDAPAFRKALQAAFVKRDQNNTVGSCPEIFVPAGRYCFNSTVVWRNNVVMRGEKGAVLCQPDAQKVLLYGHSARFAIFDNLTFEGGKNHCVIWTQNNDASIFTFTNCMFRNASEYALQSFDYATDGGVTPEARKNIKLVPPFFVEEKEGKMQLFPQDPGDPKCADAVLRGVLPRTGEYFTLKQKAAECFHFFNSTKIQVEDCAFENCGGALADECDGTTVRRCRIVTRRDSEFPAFLLGNRTTLAELDVTVKREAKLKQAVVGMFGSLVGAGACLDFHDSVIRTDNGEGVTLISADMAAKSYFGQSIRLNNLQTESKDALILFCNNVMPNIVSIVRVTDKGKGSIKAVAFETAPDAETIRRSFPLHSAKRYKPEQLFAFSFADNSPNIDLSLPETLKKFVRPLPADIEGREAFPKRLEWKGKTFLAADYGIGDEQSSQDTAKLQKLLNIAGKTPGSTVILPGRDFVLTETLRVPPQLHLTARGMAHISMADSDRDIFFLRAPEAVRFSHLALSSCRSAFNIISKAGHRGQVEIDHCSGYDFGTFAVRAFAGKTEKDGKNLTLYFHDGNWLVEKLYKGNAHAWIDSLWYESKRYPKRRPVMPWVPVESVSIVNYGKLQLTDLLGVPMPLRDVERNGRPPKGAPVGDHRWVDNCGTFLSFNCRYGTEWEGIPFVYHYGKGKTRICGGFGGFFNGRTRMVPVLTDSSDADVKIVNFICNPYLPQLSGAIVYRDETGKCSPLKKQEIYNFIPDRMNLSSGRRQER